ncbi:hypothetical protein [Ruminococcus sp.]|uniref:XAC2610-related protein n=1 Tax=Ruminococcus sp. TaxID=41978 RepID=UPI0025FB6FFD|nr:hypothetical protein [Ruminococcus sp.]MBR1431732.1 hypothetical protein [Ruminococcus sp.]
MKKCILPVILLALLSGCGKVSDASGVESRINIVSGIVEGTTRSRTTSETEAMTDGHTTGSTTSKTAGEKVSGTTTTKSKKSSVQAATRASGGNSGGSRGTTRHVPTVQRTTTTAAQPTSQTPTIDPKDYSSITFELNSSSNEIDVSREGMSGSIQVLKDVDLTEIRNTIANDPSKTINDFIVRQNDFDFDGYPDLFIIERQDDLNKTGKYYRYDPTKGTYTKWEELNTQRFEVMVNSTENSLTFYDKKDTLNYEAKTFEWGDNGLLVLRRVVKQYNDGELIDTIVYAENGYEIVSQETRDSQGNLVGEDTTEQPQED